MTISDRLLSNCTSTSAIGSRSLSPKRGREREASQSLDGKGTAEVQMVEQPEAFMEDTAVRHVSFTVS